MGWQTLRQAVPTLVIHMTAAAVHLMATVAIGESLSLGYTSFAAAVLLAAPMLAVLAMLAGYSRLGSLLCVLSFLGTAGLALFGQLGLGFLQTALYSASSPWRTLFFATAMLLPLLQVTGILEALRTVMPESSSGARLVHK